MSGFSNFFVIIPVIYLVGQVDFTEDRNVLILRVAFALVHLALFGCIGFLYTKITARNDTSRVGVTDGEDTTVVAHDIGELKKYLSQVCISLCIVGFLHFKFSLYPPLAVQCALNPMNFFNHNLVQIYLLGKDTPELRKRPWVQPSPFASLAPQAEESSGDNTSEKDDVDNMTPTMDKNSKKKESKKTQ